jgi:hypothetical protein
LRTRIGMVQKMARSFHVLRGQGAALYGPRVSDKI